MAGAGDGYAAFMAFMDTKPGEDTASTSTSADANAGGATHDSNASTEPADEYHYEEAQEREALMKNLHVPMKQWFRENPRLVDAFGEFPLFWQDLRTWQPYREVLKQYLKETESGKSSDGDAAPAQEDQAFGSKAEPTKTEESQGKQAEATASAASAESTAQANGDTDQPIKKRKKSRWGDAVAPEPSATEANAASEDGKKRKKSRWAPVTAASTAPNLLTMMTQQQQQNMALRSRLEIINQKMLTVAADAARIEKDPTRSPSPPPQYDANGKRTNTREVRMRAALEKQRQQAIEEMVKLNPNYRPPADYMRQKLSRKIYIPVNDFPNYNFIGLIIGPRGNTQKRMERETNCKIAIRGKGSVKEGSKGKKMNSDENDDLHVLITGEREDEIERAAKEVQSLLVPMDDMKNEHKQRQLRELALINGTLRDDDFCHLCGEKGHRQWECPNREKTFKVAAVKCAICGDSSHPTRDCTQRNKTPAETAAIDKEYESFMQQLGEKPVISTATKTVATAAPWLAPAKTSAPTAAKPWTASQAVGAPGTGDMPPPPGTSAQPAEMGATPETAFPPPTLGLGATPETAYPVPTIGSTPETAFPPPTMPGVANAYAYPGAAQQWNQWGAAGYYYPGYDQGTAASAGGAYDPAAYDPAAAQTAQPGVAPGQDYAYPYPDYQTHPQQ